MSASEGLGLEASESMGCSENRTRLPSLAAPCFFLLKLALAAPPWSAVELVHPDIPASVACKSTKSKACEELGPAMGCCTVATCDVCSEPT
eukprot:CAMPEP_0172914830 /NCGR_PEP_ID=MMETSP1075-20121228/193117_1 /TAXON_ID=2916 /ORGANISM="Ceratium fusus, Strain PA161109" /LENGTH=90 /DNA_ID=CAMNT_0013773805 /DNA_START=164 /DNA_END=432 /DNA_ORIENTATION=-